MLTKFVLLSAGDCETEKIGLRQLRTEIVIRDFLIESHEGLAS